MIRDGAHVAGNVDRAARSSSRPWPEKLRRAALIAGQVLAIVVVTVLPWAFGGVHAWAQAAALFVLLICVGCWSFRLLTRRETYVYLSWTLVPLLLGLLLGAVQLIPLSPGTLENVSPQAAIFRDALSGVSPPLGGELDQLSNVPQPARRWPITLYAAATRREIAALTLAVLAFVVGAHFFRKSRAQLILLLAVAANGAAIALFGIVQQQTWDGRLFWQIPLRFGGVPFGPFVNRNNAAGYLNLALGAALGVAIYAAAQYRYKAASFGEQAHDDKTRMQKLSKAVDRGAIEFFGSMSVQNLTSVTLIGLLIAAICSTLSRGGIVSMLTAGAVTTALVLTGTRHRRAIVPLLVASVIGVALISWLGLGGDVRHRVGEVFNSGGRFEHWASSLRAAADFWFTGSGLGAYSYTYRPYMEHNAISWNPHAENQYLEALVTGGVFGLSLLLAALAAVALAVREVWRHRGDVPNLALATCGLYVLVSQALQANVDFGLYLGANMVITAMILGSVCGRAALLAREDAEKGRPNRWAAMRVPPSVATLLVVGIAVVGVLSWREMRAAGVVESPTIDAATRPTERVQDRPLEERRIEIMIAALESAVAQRPDDAVAHWRLVELWNRLYQHQTAKLLRQETPARDEITIWRMADPVQLHAQAAKYAKAGRADLVEQLRAQPTVRDYLVPAWRHALAARGATPMIPEVHYLLAVLCFVGEDPLRDEGHIERMLAAAPAEAMFFFAAGVMDLDADRPQQAFQHLRQAWELNPDLHRRIIETLQGRVAIDEAIRGVYPPSPPTLVDIARNPVYMQESWRSDRLALIAEAERLLHLVEVDEKDRENVLGAIHQMRREWKAAINHQQKAVALRPDYGPWRFQLARMLAETGDIEAALAQVTRAIELEPGDTYARQLHGDLLLRRGQ